MRAFCAALMLAATPGVAQDLMSIPTLSVTTLIAPPPWATPETAVSASEIFRTVEPTDKGTTLFGMEFVPLPQDFQGWIELYSLIAEEPIARDLTAARDDIATNYQAFCADSALQPLVETPDQHIFLLFCTAYGGDATTGEMAVMHYRQKDQTLVRHAYHKRGPAFDLADPENLPMTRSDIEEMIAHVAQMRLEPGG